MDTQATRLSPERAEVPAAPGMLSAVLPFAALREAKAASPA